MASGIEAERCGAGEDQRGNGCSMEAGESGEALDLYGENRRALEESVRKWSRSTRLESLDGLTILRTIWEGCSWAWKPSSGSERELGGQARGSEGGETDEDG